MADGGNEDQTLRGQVDDVRQPVDTDDGSPVLTMDEDNAVWSVLLDPSWEQAEPQDSPPPEVMVGGWQVFEDGTAGRFFPNPDFVPSGPDVATDPTHAVLRLLARQEVAVEELINSLRDSMLDLGVDENGEPVFGESPDGKTCALVATSTAHRRIDLADLWRLLTLEDILAALPDDVDLLINPGGVESVRLMADQLRTKLREDETTENVVQTEGYLGDEVLMGTEPGS
jgi:hypothetical protein